MSKAVALCMLVISAASVVWIAAGAPRWLDDHNDFLRGFVNHELLAILGVILAITLASAAQIHLKFNDMEEKANRAFLASSRHEVKSSAYWLILSFVVALFLVMVKPLFLEHHFAIAFVNGAAIWVLLFDIMILFDMTAGIFAISATLKAPPSAPPPAPAQPGKS
jgi:uncharacterized protein YqhQ